MQEKKVEKKSLKVLHSQLQGEAKNRRNTKRMLLCSKSYKRESREEDEYDLFCTSFYE
jgi:hypothetical protein